jgi:predicted nucleic acid-binding protein
MESMSSSPKPAETWIINASPIITMAKAGQLSLFDRLANVVIPGAVVDEILNGPPSDPARKALESGWGRLASPAVIPEVVLEWGLGAGESAVLALALERPGCSAVLDDGAARRCARALGLSFLGTLGAVLRAQKASLIPLAVPVLKSLQNVGLHLDNHTVQSALEQVSGEHWPG